MGADVKEEKAAGGDTQSPLASVFPGEVVLLRSGKSLTVKPWGMEALTREVPSLLGKVFARMGSVAEIVKSGIGAEALVPVLMESMGAELRSLAAWSAGMAPEEFDSLGAADGLRVIRAVLRQNLDFFGELAGLYQDLRRELPGASGSL